MNRSEGIIAVFAIICLVIFILGFSYILFFSNKAVFPIQKNGFFMGGDEKAYQRIKVAYEMNDARKAMSLIEDFLVDYPNSKYQNKVTLTAANIFYDNKDYMNARNKALSVIDTLNKQDKESGFDDYVDTLVLMGKISKESGFFEPAVVTFLEDAYVKANEVKKSDIAVYLGYANLYQKNYTNSLRFFNSITGEYSMIGRARVYIEQNKYPEAIQEYLNYFATYPQSDRYDSVKTAFLRQSFFYSDQLRKTGLYDKAIQYLLNIVNYFPKENTADEALIKIAEIYEVHHDYSNALSFLNKALSNSIGWGDDWALLDKGRIYYEQDKKAESVKVFQILIDKYPKSLYFHKAQEWKNLIAQEAQID